MNVEQFTPGLSPGWVIFYIIMTLIVAGIAKDRWDNRPVTDAERERLINGPVLPKYKPGPKSIYDDLTDSEIEERLMANNVERTHLSRQATKWAWPMWIAAVPAITMGFFFHGQHVILQMMFAGIQTGCLVVYIAYSRRSMRLINQNIKLIDVQIRRGYERLEKMQDGRLL